MLGESIRERLREGRPVYGTHVTQTTNAVAASVLANGLDFVFLCAEHMPLDRAEASFLSCLYSSKGVAPVVRIPHPSAVDAAIALDGGAQGICAPYVETVEQVKEIVGAVHFRPVKGRRLDDYLSGRRVVPPAMQEFLARFNRHNHVVIGIESVPAYERLDELIAVEGVDAVFIGPHDLSVSLEIPEQWSNPIFLKVIEDIICRCRKARVGVGVHAAASLFSMDYMRRLIDLGMNWILDAADIGHAIKAMSERRMQLGLTTGVEAPAGAVEPPQSCATVNPQNADDSLRPRGVSCPALA